MIKRKLGKVLACILAFSLAGCGNTQADTETTVKDFISDSIENGNTQITETVANTVSLEEAKEDIEFKDSDYYKEYGDDSVTKITFDDSTCDISGDGASFADGVLTIKAEGSYVLSGNLNGRIVISAGEKDKVYLYLDNVSVVSSDGPAIAEESADKVVISLTDNSANYFEDAASYSAGFEDYTACLFFKDSLTINGEGSLSVMGNFNDGITTKDTIKIMSGDIKVNASDECIVGRDKLIINEGKLSLKAGGHGLKTTNEEKGCVYILGGNMEIESGQDGLNIITDLYIYGGNLNISAEDDGIHADNSVNIAAGEIYISKSYEGIEGLYINIDGGNINIVSQDDGLNATTGNGGEFGNPWENFGRDSGGDFGGDFKGGFGGNVGAGFSGEMPQAGFNGEMPRGEFGGEMPREGFDGQRPDFDSSSGERPDNIATEQQGSSSAIPYIVINGGNVYINASGDGIDSNGSIEINGGYIVVDGPGDNGNGALDYDRILIMNGGTLIATGSSGMYQSISEESSLYVINYLSNSTISAGSNIKIMDGDTVLCEFTTVKNGNTVLFSSDKLVNGNQYTLCVNDATFEVSAEAGGGYEGFTPGNGAKGGKNDRNYRKNY